MFEKVKRFYELGLYTEAQVYQFVIHGKITEEEYKNIVKEEDT